MAGLTTGSSEPIRRPLFLSVCPQDSSGAIPDSASRRDPHVCLESNLIRRAEDPLVLFDFSQATAAGEDETNTTQVFVTCHAKVKWEEREGEEKNASGILSGPLPSPNDNKWVS